MDQLFISYARSDLDAVTAIEAGLKAAGIGTWRDQDRLYGGQRWPKALGEAIAARQGFLLFWSKAAAASHFVEVEWSTAVALKKPIIPCRLDDTPLPPTLSALQTVAGAATGGAVKEILAALTAWAATPAESGALKAALAELAEIPAGRPADVARAVRQRFRQEGWIVQGNVYQAAGDIHIIQTGAGTPRAPASRIPARQARIALLAALLAGLILLSDLPGKLENAFQGFREERTLSGVVWDDQGQPVAGAEVAILERGLTTTTDAAGSFRFRLKGERDQEVRLLARKPGYRGDPQYTTLGARVDLSLRRTP